MLKKLQQRFIWITMVLVGTVMLLGIAAFCYITYHQQSLQLDEALQVSARRAMLSWAYGTSSRDAQGSLGTQRDAQNTSVKTYTVLVNQEGDILGSYGSENEIDDDVSWHELAGKVLRADGMTGKLSSRSLRYKRLPLSADGTYSIISFVSYKSLRSYLTSVITFASLLFCGLMVVMFVISWFLSRVAIKPVRKAWVQQQQFIADASHELKTPLTVILANNKILLSHQDWEADKQRKWIENSQAEAGHMKKLVDNLLYLARSDASKSKTILSDVNMGELTMDVLLQFEPVAFEKGLTLDYTGVDTEIHLQGDSTKLKQLVHILVDNACKYGARGTSVEVKLTTRGGRPVFSVHNRGNAIATEDLPHLFERFYRANKARNRDESSTGGYGLGLAIAKSIAEDHGAKISVTSTAAEGTVFTVEFKRS